MFKNITLELSLKPFKHTDDLYIRKICSQIFKQWSPLLKERESVSVMLWVGDGSEILDYAGKNDDKIEWCRFVGTANLPYLAYDEPLETSLHQRKQDYIQNAPQMTYGLLKKIVSTLKEEGKKAFPNTIIRVGETIDIGPEFAISDFKYKRHREIIGSLTSMDSFVVVDCTAKLHKDTHSYAAYPNGIPEGTPFGTFLGKQAKAFCEDLGFDYLWLSNGLGFSADPWKKTGKIFDGDKYYPEALDYTKGKVFEFWKLFREACPDILVETRGTNHSVGIDYASDGVPLYDIYNANLNIVAPPNSPWAALNDNYGLEIMGHMTRICELPSERFPFRYYIHDPWWINSPWYDRYDGAPSDIYLPMAISRITSKGKVESANSLNILSIDNSFGNMPDACVNEPLPHLLKAEKDVADEVAPLVWIYPMREYTTSQEESLLREMNLGDNFVCNAINDGFPLCCVTSTDNFLKHDMEIYRKSILVSPVPENPVVLKKLKDFSEKQIVILMYGTREKLNRVSDSPNLYKLDIANGSRQLRETIATLGYEIHFNKKQENTKVPTMAIVRHNGAMIFSAYNANTTTDVQLRFPQGAPILCGAEAEMIDGYSVYHFGRSEHRECRVYVKQESGVISCREHAPVNMRYRRKILIRGLKDATVSLFSEKGCECAVSGVDFVDATPITDERFQRVFDEKEGEYLKGEHIDGDIFFLIGHADSN